MPSKLEKRKAHKVLVGNLNRKRPLGQPQNIWKDKIITDLKRHRMGESGWFRLAWNSKKRRNLAKTIAKSSHFIKADNLLTERIFAQAG